MSGYWTTERTFSELVAALAIASFLVALIFFFASKKKIVAALRILGVFLFVWAFGAPTFVRTTEAPPPTFVVLDESASAARPADDSEKGAKNGRMAQNVGARIVASARIVENEARRRGVAISFRTLDGAAISLDDYPTRPSASSSPLSDFVRFAGDGARVLLISDGIQNGDASTKNGDLKVGSVDAIAVGNSRPALDWRWENFAAATVLYSGEKAAFSADLRLRNANSDAKTVKMGRSSRRAFVRLWGTPSAIEAANDSTLAFEPKLFWERAVDVEFDENGNGKTRVEYSWEQPNATRFDYFLSVADFEDADAPPSFETEKNGSFESTEFCMIDNSLSFEIVRKERKLAVLLVDDAPRYEYRYLRELLRREDSVSLRTILLSADAEVVAADENALLLEKLDRRTLATFDVVLVGDVPPERWRSTLERLTETALRVGSSTSIWFLGGARTATSESWRESPARRLAPGAEVDANVNDKTASDDSWRLRPTARGRAVYPALTPFFDSLDESFENEKNATKIENGSGSSEIGGDAVDFSTVFQPFVPGPGADVLFSARRRSDGREIPLFIVAALGKNKILLQGTDELWRLRTLGDKTIYRRFVLRTLEFLTDERESVGADADASSEPRSNLESDALDAPFFENRFLKKIIKDPKKNVKALLLEQSDVAARADFLRELTASNGGAFLDLRDCDESASADALAAFIGRRFDKMEPIPVQQRVFLAPKKVVFPFLFLVLFAIWFFERRFDSSTNEKF